MYNIFLENGFSVIKVNFRGVGKSDGVFDNGQGELSDAAAALDWIERQNLDYSQCWVSGFSFGSLICMQLIMRRPEVNNFVLCRLSQTYMISPFSTLPNFWSGII